MKKWKQNGATLIFVKGITLTCPQYKVPLPLPILHQEVNKPPGIHLAIVSEPLILSVDPLELHVEILELLIRLSCHPEDRAEPESIK